MALSTAICKLLCSDARMYLLYILIMICLKHSELSDGRKPELNINEAFIGNINLIQTNHATHIRAHFLSIAQSKLRLCSANYRPGYWSNPPCDWPNTAWANSEQETENRLRTAPLVKLSIKWSDTDRPLREVWMERWAAIRLGHLPETEVINKAEAYCQDYCQACINLSWYLQLSVFGYLQLKQMQLYCID